MPTATITQGLQVGEQPITLSKRPLEAARVHPETIRVPAGVSGFALKLPCPPAEIQALMIKADGRCVPPLACAWDRASGVPFPWGEQPITLDNPTREELAVELVVLHTPLAKPAAAPAPAPEPEEPAEEVTPLVTAPEGE